MVRAALYYLFEAIKVLILIRAVMSWLPLGYNKHLNRIAEMIYIVTEPVLAPIRALMDKAMGNRMMMIDISPILAYMILGLLERLVLSTFLF